MPTSKKITSIYIEDAKLKELTKIAKQEDRSRTKLIERILLDFLKKKKAGIHNDTDKES